MEGLFGAVTIPYAHSGASMKILVRNLSRDTSEAALLALFEVYGDVQYCKLVMDKATGKSKGFGFVEMPRPGEARAAIKSLNYQDVDGNRIRVKKAEKSGEEVPGKRAGPGGRD
jgi:RNA recognition motif-containing protein